MKWLRKRKPNRKRDVEPQPLHWQRPARVLAVVAVLGAASWAVASYLEHSDWERFQTLEISGELERVSAEEVAALLKPYIASGFARIDIRAAQAELEAQPWVAEAAVRRQWPGTLVVELREERPVATWFGTSLMNAAGEVFVDGAAGFTGVLPDIGGPAGTQTEMIERMNDLDEVFGTHGLAVRRLLRTERRAERLWLANGIEVRLGRRDADVRLRRFLNAAWPSLQARAAEVAYVDMRYTNGFAVGWKANRADGRGERANVQENG